MSDLKMEPQARTISYYERRYKSLDDEAATLLPLWKELAKMVSPVTAQFEVEDKDRGREQSFKHILDSAATMAHRALVAGFCGNVTAPTRPWFEFAALRPEHREREDVRRYLYDTREILAWILLKSNLYTELPKLYGDVGLYGTSLMLVVPDQEDVVRFQVVPFGSYRLGVDARGRVNAMARELEFTVEQLVNEFGIDNVSDRVRDRVKAGDLSTTVKVRHHIEPNQVVDASRLESRYTGGWVSDYYEVGEKEKFLRQSGFSVRPFVAPRWTVYGSRVWGLGPGAEALGYIVGVQQTTRRKLQVLDKFTQPAYVAAEALRRRGLGLLSGDVTYANGRDVDSVKAVHALDNPHLNEIREEIADLRYQIDKAFYKDLFLMLAQDQRTGRTATEINERVEEKMLALGPVYTRLIDEGLDPIITASLDIARGAGRIPPPTGDVGELDIAVEYVSTMALAMKAVGVTNIERALTFAGTLLPNFQDVTEVVDGVGAVRTYFEKLSVPPTLLRSQEEVEARRAADAKVAEQQAQLANAQQAADAAQKLGSTPLPGGESALSQLLSNIQPPLAAGEGNVQ